MLRTKTISRAWRLAGHISTAQWLYQVFAPASLTALILGGLAVIDGQPWWFVCLLGVAAFALCGLGLLGFVTYRKSRAPNPSPSAPQAKAVDPVDGSMTLLAEARAIEEQLKGRVQYAERVLADGSDAELRKWLGKVELQRVPFSGLTADLWQLPTVQLDNLGLARRALDELDKAVDLLATETRDRDLAQAVGIYRHRAIKAHVMVGKLLTSMGDARTGETYMVTADRGAVAVGRIDALTVEQRRFEITEQVMADIAARLDPKRPVCFLFERSGRTPGMMGLLEAYLRERGFQIGSKMGFNSNASVGLEQPYEIFPNGFSRGGRLVFPGQQTVGLDASL